MSAVAGGGGRAYYNEIEPAAAHVLRCLIADGLIAPGDVDTRSIKDVQPDDLAGYTQCHFFAGAGLWSVAARLAGWPDDRPLWTGSCPCQPFSAAGRGLGTDDPRHLWPDFFRLIRECRPPVVFGEQVATAAGKRTAIDEDMHSMWRGEDLSGFLPHQGISRQFDWLSCEMQNLLPGMAGELSDWLEGAEVGFFPQVPGEEPRFHSGVGRALSGEAGRVSVRFGRLDASASGQDRRGPMRDVRTAIQVGWRPDLGQSVARPDHPGAWLHDHECSSGAVRPQRDDEHVGRRSGLADRGLSEGDAGIGCEQLIGAMGSQAEEAAGLDWLDGIAADLDTIGYSLGAPDIPACAVDAPHIRQRLWWCAVADTDGAAVECGRRELPDPQGAQARRDGDGHRRDDVVAIDMADASGTRLALGSISADQRRAVRGEGAASLPNHSGSGWRNSDWLVCHDGKARRTEPGLRLLVDGMAGRVPAWRLAGNSISPVLAAEVIGAYLDAERTAA